jgi:hypothetical protein
MSKKCSACSGHSHVGDLDGTLEGLKDVAAMIAGYGAAEVITQQIKVLNENQMQGGLIKVGLRVVVPMLMPEIDPMITNLLNGVAVSGGKDFMTHYKILGIGDYGRQYEDVAERYAQRIADRVADEALPPSQRSNAYPVPTANGERERVKVY